MFKPVSSRVAFPKLEEEVLAFWQERRIFEKSLELRADAPRYVFFEGPPTANGRPGIHHVLSRVFKDVVLRYWTMRGYYVGRKAGWDTHGLPVELEVEKELGITGKPQIEAYGVANFNARCRESVWRYVKEWEALTDRIAFWLDTERAYVTYDNGYVESCWWILRQFWDRGLLYQDYKVTPYCPRCGTSLSSHEVALGYKDDVPDPSVYVRFRLTADLPGGRPVTDDAPTFFLVWTTTPWTLPGNAALAVAPDATYAVVEPEEGERVRLILAEALIGQALGSGWRVVDRRRGEELVGATYEPLYSFLPLEQPAHRVVPGDFVSLEDGTGIVHMAPAFGEVDLETGRKENLPVIQTVDLRGRMVEQAGELAGLFVKEADPKIVEDLRRRGLLQKAARILHTYPFCWRCDTPLLYYAKPSWYIRTTAFRERLLAGNERINWYPEHIKHGRFGEWLRGNVDWALSRERYWGTPLPIWRCSGPGCEELVCIGGLAELRVRAVSNVPADLDLHRPFVDEIELHCERCGGPMRRVPDVIDCWFDSGAMPVAQWHYPFENQATFVENFPADYISEAVDQTRGWFYSLHAISTLLFSRPSYLNVICLGHILDARGEKMSKSRGNVVNPWDVIGEYGADAVRWYLYTASPPGNPRRFSADLVAEAVRKFLLTLWNTYTFFTTYAILDGWQPSAEPIDERVRRGALELSLLDRWILSELHELVGQVNEQMGQYDPTSAGRAIQAFVDDLSNWYVRRSRRRFWKSENDADKEAAYSTLYECLATLANLLAPFTPFAADAIYQNLVGAAGERLAPGTARESVHLADFPTAVAALVQPALNEQMRAAMRVVSLGRAARSKARLKVRQPLQTVLVKTRAPEERAALESLAAIVLDELNVKELRFTEDEAELVQYQVKPNFAALGPKLGRDVGRVAQALKMADGRAIARAVRAGQDVTVDGYTLAPEDVLVETTERAGYAVAEEAGYVVGLSTAITPQLADEGLARELVHRLQELRKKAGFEIADRIVTFYQGSDRVRRVFGDYADYVQAETLSQQLVSEVPPADAFAETQQLEGEEVRLGVRRA